jgi:T-complex protein 1 subunit delta
MYILFTQIDHQVVVNDYRQMDKILKEERNYLLGLCKKIKQSGCNVLLIQKSILKDAVTDISLNFLSRLKILAIKEIERDEVEFICKVMQFNQVYWLQAHRRYRFVY